MRPTRQSLTMRFVIPKRNMVARNETGPWNKERESGMKRRIPFFVIGISSCFVLPCFVPGCHAFDFKIAAAALRPRNDTNLERFYLENGRFAFLRLFFARYRPASFFKRFAPKIVPFSRKTFLEPPALPVVFLLQGKALATVFCSFYCYSTKAFSFLGAVFCYSSILFAFRHLLGKL